ncbi:hypothetical protein TD95_001887 [Thielaviopsis punctulata]|uniref:Neutral ceramidase n=1 Tax=Thielaviopsis punctulata TaxID=72032 RepID=A0A0F4ZDT1_9PEZI|nr:hypothetical protein TD95_001887 [Thielaviopsis punctulata]
MPPSQTRKAPPELPFATRHNVHLQQSEPYWRLDIARCFLYLFVWATASFVLAQLCFPELLVPPVRQSSLLPVDNLSDVYLAGAGRADITGPVVEINMMGYADPAQVGSGLRQRLYSRAFIVAEKENPAQRLVYLVLDTQSGDTAIRNGILDALKDLGSPYNTLYGTQNVAVTGTHSHSGPGAWLNYLLPQITSKGFDKQSYQAIVSGAVLSIKRAHESMVPARLALGSTKLRDASINRSLYAYLANPEAERQKYNASQTDDGSVDSDMHLLRFQRVSDNTTFAVLTWFPTHGTSMLGNNTLISGDNKGVAASLLEKTFARAQSSDTASTPFVAGFSQASVGDVSPNVLGAWCEDGSGAPCTFENSTCANGRSQACHARGPLFRVPDRGASSCFEIGRRQAAAAQRILHAPDGLEPVRGASVRAVHMFHDMAGFEFSVDGGRTSIKTCAAALGYSFAAGTSDGPGAFDFTQNDGDGAHTSPVWKAVSHLLHAPDEAQRACHAPKPILLDVGQVARPYAWTPNIVDVQLLRIGSLAVIVSPGEASTMAGRRWMHAVQQRATEYAGADVKVVLGGPANTYAHYITTAEEYTVQRYEGASTLYGPHTLAAYINRSVELVPLLYAATHTQPTSELGPAPPDNRDKALSFIPGVVYDGHMPGSPFGHVLADAAGQRYGAGDVVRVTFVGANPRNNLRLEDTYAAVERRVGSESWARVRDDSDWDLVFEWKRQSSVLGTSEVVVTWFLDENTEAGEYRLRYYGDAKGLGGKIAGFNGTSGVFEVG